MAFDASLARKSWRERRESWEKERVKRLEQVTTAVRGYFEDKPVKAVYVAGFLTRPGAYRPGSEIDIAVEGLPRDRYLASLNDLQDILGTDWVNLIEMERYPRSSRIETYGERIL